MRALASAIFVCWSSVAHADDWYGEQTLATDAVAYGGIIAGFSRDHVPLVLTGLATYAVGAPLVHLAHGETGLAGRSLGGRLLLPVAGAMVGAVVGAGISDDADCESIECGVGIGLGVVGGMLAATVIDAIAARESGDETEAVLVSVGGAF